MLRYQFGCLNAGAAAFKNKDGCLAWVNTGGCIWTPDSPDPEACFVCEAKAVSVGAIKEIDALATASASHPLYFSFVPLSAIRFFVALS